MMQHLEFEQGRRIIAISDIHGDLSSLQSLLTKVNYSEYNDYLIIMGDMIEKGRENLDTIHYLMTLKSRNARVFVLKGNCDRILENVMDNDNNIPETLKYLTFNKNSIFHEMAENVGTSIETAEDLKYVLTYLKDEKEFIDSLPTALISEDFIFVHAGIRDLDNENDSKYHLTARNYYNSGIDLGKYVVVGHYPVCNYSQKLITNNPIIDLDKKIISIDGGNRVKIGGQLNALIIEKVNDAYTFTYRSVADFEKRLFKPFHAGNENNCKIVMWPNLEVSMQERKEITSIILNYRNELMEVRNEFLKQDDKGKWFFISDYTDHYFTLTAPKLGYVIYENDEEVLASIDGVHGWIKK